MALTLPSCDWFSKKSGRETIFDKVVSIPKEWVLGIPKLPPLCDEIAGLKKGFIEVEAGKLYYEKEGQGVPLVLISGGLGGTHHVFHPYFSQIKDFAHIIYYDQRGTGKSSCDDTGKTYTVKQAVEDLESLRKALKIDRWAVLGWSYGGLLAQCYALTYPERCMSLILGAATTGIPFESNRKREQQFISQAELDAIDNIGKMAREGKITSVQSGYNMWHAGFWKRYAYYKPTEEEIIRKARYGFNPAQGFEEPMRADSDKLSSISFLKGKFDNFEIPTLIAEAQWELAWWDPERAKVMRTNHPHAQVEIFERSGHQIFADEPEKFFSLLKDFLAKSSKLQITYKPGNRLAWPKLGI